MWAAGHGASSTTAALTALPPLYGVQSYGGDGVFLAAAVLFFSYVGYDAICNAAEEVCLTGWREECAWERAA